MLKPPAAATHQPRNPLARAFAAALVSALAWGTALAQPTRVATDVVVSGQQNPGAVAFLGDGRMLVTERPGRLRVVGPNGTLGEPVAGVPKVDAVGQGGLLD
ncbi:MAG: PQQ-dependent sugar dehydrogenase, partial [Hydrogenophaga sp.]|nr:PQQ-dependent sugar dehydrogenase [Hydrogenophaga sp.]